LQLSDAIRSRYQSATRTIRTHSDWSLTYPQCFHLFLDVHPVEIDLAYYRVLVRKLLFHLIDLMSLDFQLTLQFFGIVLIIQRLHANRKYHTLVQYYAIELTYTMQ